MATVEEIKARFQMNASFSSCFLPADLNDKDVASEARIACIIKFECYANETLTRRFGNRHRFSIKPHAVEQQVCERGS